MKKIIAEYGDSIKTFAVILAVAILVVGIVKSDAVKASFENIIPNFMEQVEDQTQIEIDGNEG